MLEMVPSLEQHGASLEVPDNALNRVWTGGNLLSSRTGKASVWTVTLCQILPKSGAALAGFPVNITARLEARYVAQVVWGAGQATETALVDWMPLGNSFTVSGSTVQVNVLSLNPVQGTLSSLPRLTAFMTKGRRSSTLEPTLTSTFQSIVGVGVTAQFVVPPRAVGYRVVHDSQLTVGASYKTWQINLATGTPVEFDNVEPTATELASTPEGLTSNRGAFYRLHPLCNVVEITSGIAGAFNVAVQWLLDLG